METQLLTSLVEGRVRLSIPAVWPAGCTEAHRAGPCANLLSVLQGASCVHPQGPVRGCSLLEAVSSPGVRPQAAALAVGVPASPDPGGLRPPSLHRPCFTGQSFQQFLRLQMSSACWKTKKEKELCFSFPALPALM